MSISQNQKLRDWKVVEEHLRREALLEHKERLTKRDCQTFSSAIFLQSLFLEDVLTGRSPSRESRIPRWRNAIVKVDPFLLGVALKVWLAFFRNYFSWDRPLDYTGFKHQFCATYPFVGEFFSPIKEEVERFLSTPDPLSFYVLNTHLQFVSRVSFQDVDFNSQCLEEYLAIESELCGVRYDYPLLNDLNQIIRGWLKWFSYEEFLPSHGPGAVAGLPRTASKFDKYRRFGKDSLLTYFTKNLSEGHGDYFPSLTSDVPLDRACEIVFVPKTMISKRTISKEPATLQYFQQGVWHCLDRCLQRSQVAVHLDIHDQLINRGFAQFGSATSEFATIDLSAASDRVSWELVKHVFRGTPIFAACYATRSKFAILPDGRRVPLRKFAPMGSALCFPIECLVFAAICEHVVRQRGYRRSNPYSVYGDDIVVRSELASDVVYLLHRCGFKVNSSKTFIAQNLPFRESCGGEFFKGVDVSPFRLSRRFSSLRPSTKSPEIFQSHIDGANLAHQHGLKSVRLWFIHRLLQLPRNLQPIFGEDYDQLYSEEPTNYHLKRIYSKDWQCELFICGGLNTPVAERTEEDETLALFEWLRATRFRRQFRFPFADDVVTGESLRSRVVLRSRRALGN